VLALTLAHAVRWGYTTARSYVPGMHDAWWDTLTHLRDTTGRDAIVHTWWDYGHWITYVAERRVSNDGSSLLTHIPYWVARALVAPAEAESVGTFRMLSCGSDATPAPEGARGAYGKLRATGRDAATARAVLGTLLPLDPAAAERELASRGLTASQRADVLRSTHCDPPEAYVVLTSGLVGKRRTWMAFGLWDRQPPIVDRFAFVPRWIPCRAAPGATGVVCEVHAPIGPGSRYIDTVVYDVGAPHEARLRRRSDQAALASDGAPAVVLLAGAREIREMTVRSPTDSDLGVLIDATRPRILVGSAAFLRSTFVHLMYLDGRYARRYQKFDDRTAAGERVVTWKIDWNGR
jgi:hypothetical protein